MASGGVSSLLGRRLPVGRVFTPDAGPNAGAASNDAMPATSATRILPGRGYLAVHRTPHIEPPARNAFDRHRITDRGCHLILVDRRGQLRQEGGRTSGERGAERRTPRRAIGAQWISTDDGFARRGKGGEIRTVIG